MGTDGSDLDLEVLNCRSLCYSRILCRYWQFVDEPVAGGCYIEAPAVSYESVPYPLSFAGGGVSNQTVEARHLLAGEYIQHYCHKGLPWNQSASLQVHYWDTPQTLAKDEPLWDATFLACILILTLVWILCHVLCLFRRPSKGSYSVLSHQRLSAESFDTESELTEEQGEEEDDRSICNICQTF